MTECTVHVILNHRLFNKIIEHKGSHFIIQCQLDNAQYYTTYCTIQALIIIKVLYLYY